MAQFETGQKQASSHKQFDTPQKRVSVSLATSGPAVANGLNQVEAAPPLLSL